MMFGGAGATRSPALAATGWFAAATAPAARIPRTQSNIHHGATKMRRNRAVLPCDGGRVFITFLTVGWGSLGVQARLAVELRGSPRAVSLLLVPSRHPHASPASRTRPLKTCESQGGRACLRLQSGAVELHPYNLPYPASLG